jgi:hypothetical protein
MDQLDSAWSNMLAEPMIFNHIMLRMWCHLARFQLAKGQGTNIIFMNFDVHIRFIFYHHVHFEDRADLFSQIN